MAEKKKTNQKQGARIRSMIPRREKISRNAKTKAAERIQASAQKTVRKARVEAHTFNRDGPSTVVYVGGLRLPLISSSRMLNTDRLLLCTAHTDSAPRACCYVLCRLRPRAFS